MERRSRWGPPRAADRGDGELVTVLPAGMTQSQVNAYLLHVRLAEISARLNGGRCVPDHECRSPSPEPHLAGLDREQRWRKRLEDERADLIEEALRNSPELTAAAIDYTRDKRDRGKCQEKVWIPQREHPEVNFIGLLIGPRGNTLKNMESESGAKISIRGKGSLKEGRVMDDETLAAAEEELHALVSADHPEKVSTAVRLINRIVETAATQPEAANALKQIQLRQLAALNGTLRDQEASSAMLVLCANCGQPGHRKFECMEGRNAVAATVCRICGGAGHLAGDCVHRNDVEMVRQSQQRARHIDAEYLNFMAELGQKQ